MMTYLRTVLFTFCLVAIAQGMAFAQTYTTTLSATGTNSTTWSAATWTGGTPLGSATTVITINESATGGVGTVLNTFTDDLTGTTNSPFQLTTLNFTTSATNSGQTVSLAGNAFSFIGSTNTITTGGNANVTDGISPNISFINGLTFTLGSFASPLNINGVISGSGGVTIGGGANAGRVTFNNQNTYSGGTTLNAGTLVVSNTGGNSLGNTGTLTLNGGLFATVNSPTITNAVLVRNNIQLNSGTNIQNNSPTFSGAFNLGGGMRLLTIDDAFGNTVKLTGLVSNGGLITSGLGTLILSGTTNSYAGGTTITKGITQFNVAGATGTGSITITGGGSLNATGGAYTTINNWLASNKISTISNGDIALTATSTGTENINFTGYDNLMLGATSNITYTGTITAGSLGYNLGGGGSTLTLSLANSLTGTNAVNIGALGQAFLVNNPTFTAGSGVLVGAVASTGTVTLTNANDTTGATSIRSSTLKLSAAASNSFGALTNSTINVNNGTTLAIDSVNAAVIPSSVTRAAAVNLNSGKFTVATETGTLVAPGNSNDVITGALTFNSGFSTVTVTGTGTGSARLTAGSLASNGGGGLVNGVNLGNGAPGTAGTVSILFGTTPSITGTGSFAAGLTGSTSTNKALAIIPYLVGEVGATAGNGGTATGVANTFLTYDTTNGLRPLDLTNEYNTLANLNAGTATGNNIRVVASGTLTTSGTVNSLIVTGSGATASTLTINDGLTLTNTSGAILFNGGATTYAINPSGTSGALAFGSNAADISISGTATATIKAVMTGTGGLNKYGSGTLVLSSTSNTLSGNVTLHSGNMTISGANTSFTGTTTVLAGTLSVGNSSALGTSTVLIGDTSGSAAAGLTITSSTFTRPIIIQSGNIGTVTLTDNTGTNNDKATAAIQLGSTNGIGHGVTLSSGALNGFTGVISDPTGLVAGTAGVVTINGNASVSYFGNSNNSYTGGTVITGGVLSIGGNGTAFGTGPVVLNGGTFNQISGGTVVGGYSSLILNSDLNLSNSGIKLTGTFVNLGSTGIATTRNIISSANNPGVGFDLELDGVIQDGTNGYTKGITFSGGGYTIIAGANTYTGTTTIAGGVQVQVNSLGTVSGASPSNLGQPGAGNSTINFGATTNSGTLVYKGAASTSDRGINLAGTTGGATLVGSGSGTLTLTGSVTATGLGAKKLTLAGTKTGNVLSGDISDSAGGATGVIQNDTGGWTLAGNNTYTGGTSIVTGTLTTNSSNALGSGQVAITAASTAKLILNSNLTIDSLTTVLATPTVGSAGSGYTSAPTVTVSAPYPGGTQATATTSLSGTTGTIGSVTATNLGTNYASAPTYTLSGGGGTGGSINANYAASSVSLGSSTLTLTGTGTAAYGGNITGTGGSLIKNGIGTQVLAGTNSYTGTTSINAGSLVVDGIISGTGSVTVGNNTAVATLAGTGRVNGSVTTSTTGGNVAHISPGDAVTPIGTLTIAGSNFTVGDGTLFDFDLTTNSAEGNGFNDLIMLSSGVLTFSGTTTFNFNSSAVTVGDNYTVIDGASSVVGFNASNFLATNTGTLTATFQTDGNAIYVTFSSGGVSPTVAYFNGLGANLNTPGNFDTSVSGTVLTSATVSGTTNVFFSANRNGLTSANTSGALAVNSLNFGVGSGTNSGITVSGTSAITINATGVNGNRHGQQHDQRTAGPGRLANVDGRHRRHADGERHGQRHGHLADEGRCRQVDPVGQQHLRWRDDA